MSEKERRQCIFCPERATTGEHIWSNWANPLLGKRRRYKIRQEIQDEVRTWNSVGLHQKFPLLCDTCNHEWGGKLETRMKEICSDMVRDGAPTLLSATDVATIAMWSQLKAFISDCAQEGHIGSFHEFGTRRAFRMNFTFPTGTNMWLARTYSTHGIYKGVYAKAPLETPKRFHSYIFTMSIGQLVVQVTSVRWTKKSNRKYASPPNFTQGPAWNRFCVPIWPNCITPIYWPPSGQLRRDELDALVERWKIVNRTD